MAQAVQAGGEGWSTHPAGGMMACWLVGGGDCSESCARLEPTDYGPKVTAALERFAT